MNNQEWNTIIENARNKGQEVKTVVVEDFNVIKRDSSIGSEWVYKMIKIHKVSNGSTRKYFSALIGGRREHRNTLSEIINLLK